MAVTRLLDIASRSLGVYQRALDVTAHNVSNANNPQYSRQRVVLTAEKSEIRADGDWGTGVSIRDILRVRDNLNEIQIRTYNQKYSAANKKSELLGQIETVFAEPSDSGLSSLINKFFNSWDKLAASPNDTSLRNAVVQSAQLMGDKLQNIHDGLAQVKEDISSEMTDRVKEINNYIVQIQGMNKQIVESTNVGNVPNDLMDKRDDAIAELSKLVNITVNYDNKGSANISIGGVFATDSYNYVQFKADNTNGQLSMVTEDGTTRVAINSGELFSFTDLFNNKIPDYQSKIDTVANSIMNSVNTAHSTGYTLQTPPTTGLNFFDNYANGKLTINANILADVKNIAVSGNGQSGNGDIAVLIAGLTKSGVISGETIGNYYSSIVSTLGADKLLQEQNASSNQLVLDQLELQKESVSGVSVDEEMTNVIKFQRSYDASARLIKIADEMLQTLLSMV